MSHSSRWSRYIAKDKNLKLKKKQSRKRRKYGIYSDGSVAPAVHDGMGEVTTCWVWCPWRRCPASDVSVPLKAGPCRCRPAQPGNGAEACLSAWLSSLEGWVKVSYVRTVCVLAGQLLKHLKCGHTPHVAAGGRVTFVLFSLFFFLQQPRFYFCSRTLNW